MLLLFTDITMSSENQPEGEGRWRPVGDVIEYVLLNDNMHELTYGTIIFFSCCV